MNKIKSFKFPLPGEKRIFEMHVLLVFISLETFSFRSQMFNFPSISASTILFPLNANDVIGAIKFCKVKYKIIYVSYANRIS